ncbi:nocturnin-like isoform X3, partial [Leptotrombidium deliense]
LAKRSYTKVDENGYIDNENSITVMQWNILSQAIGYTCDRFDTCAEKDLLWSSRKWKIIYEIAQYMPLDVICLQEVDHYDFIERMLIKVGYRGTFTPKPDSPCYYISGNTGPDGCAIFYNASRLTLLKSSSRILQVFECESNQVVLNCKFKCKSTGKVFCVSTTHLKARKGPMLSFLRDEQGKDIVDFLDNESGTTPTIITGDFNAEPCEPVYDTITSKYESAYFTALGDEPLYTNWTKRVGEEEMKQTIDYVFYSPENFEVKSVLDLNAQHINSPLPNSQYASDHLSLVAQFHFK